MTLRLDLRSHPSRSSPAPQGGSRRRDTPNQAIGTTNNGLKPNGGTNGALELPIGPSTGATGSFGLYFEAQVDPALAYGNGASQTPFTGLTLLTNTSSGQPSFMFNASSAGRRERNGGRRRMWAEPKI